MLLFPPRVVVEQIESSLLSNEKKQIQRSIWMYRLGRDGEISSLHYNQYQGRNTFMHEYVASRKQS